MSPEMKQAKTKLKEAFDLVGENGLRSLIIDLASAQLVMAMNSVFSDVKWVEMLYAATSEPQHANLQWLCKLMDTLVPKPQAVKTLTDMPDQFIVQYTKEEDAKE